MFRLPKVLTIFLFLLLETKLCGQFDTEFWFVAPDISQSSLSFDSPVAFTISTGNLPADITISMPANPAWQPIISNLGVNQQIRIPIQQAFTIENGGPNTVENKGILIKSTAEVAVYYEILGQCLCNPDILTLKGCNALGKHFFVPMQRRFDSSDLDSPQPRAKFDIVATVDNTSIIVNPTSDLIGHPANQPFQFTLNKGETYSCHVASLLRTLRASGTEITSTFPIAVTLSDDLMQDPNIGSCRDLGADQLIPVNKTGKEYIAIAGKLNIPSIVYLVSTQGNTQVSANGTQYTLNLPGETLDLPITAANLHISCSKPCYALQLSGIGCEAALAILNPVDYFENTSLQFVRTTDEPFHLQIVCTPDIIGSFEVNGSSNQISPFDFTLTPDGKFATGSFDLSPTIVPQGAASRISNTDGPFIAGFIHGQPSVTGARFAFFSDFGVIPEIEYSAELCPNDSVILNGRVFYNPGVFSDTLGLGTACDTIIKYNISPRIGKKSSQEMQLCQDQSITFLGQTFFIPGNYYLISATSDSCFEEIQLVITHGTEFNLPVYASLCTGQEYNFYGQSLSTPGLYTHTVSSAVGCDTIYTLHLTTQSFVHSDNLIELCAGDTLIYQNQTITDAAVLYDTIQGGLECDTILKTIIMFNLPYTEVIVDSFCINSGYILGNDTITSPGVYQIQLTGNNGQCDSIIEVRLSTYSYLNLNLDTLFCPNTLLSLGQNQIIDPGIYYTIAKGTGMECDTLLRWTVNHLPLPAPFLPEDTVICNPQSITITSPYIQTTWGHYGTQQQVTLTQPDSLTVQYTNLEGCTAEETLRVRKCCGDASIYVPNAFKPESISNDLFQPFISGVCRLQYFEIYDRWGELVFRSNEHDQAWRGTSVGGRKVNPGVYVYVIYLVDSITGVSTTISGDITLVR